MNTLIESDFSSGNNYTWHWRKSSFLSRFEQSFDASVRKIKRKSKTFIFDILLTKVCQFLQLVYFLMIGIRCQAIIIENYVILRKSKKARPRFELGISSLLVRRFNQLSHRAMNLMQPFCINKTSPFYFSPKSNQH